MNMTNLTTEEKDEQLFIKDFGIIASLDVYKVLGGGLDTANLKAYNQQTSMQQQQQQQNIINNEWSGIYTQFKADHTLGTVPFRWEQQRHYRYDEDDDHESSLSVFTEAVLVRITLKNLHVIVLDGTSLYDSSIPGGEKAQQVKQLLAMPSTEPLIHGLGEQNKVALVRETADEWECVLPHNLIPRLNFTETIVARFQRHTHLPVTNRWCVAGEPWQHYHGDDEQLLERIPDLSLSCLFGDVLRENDNDNMVSSSADVGCDCQQPRRPVNSWWAHPDADMIPLPCYHEKVALSAEDIEAGGCNCNSSSSSCIYLGPQQCARKAALQDIMAAKITGIVNCTKLYPNHHEDVNDIEYCNVPVNDESGADLLLYMDGTTQFMHRHLLEDDRGSVLVHCQMGVSRSASMVVAYLIRYHDMCREDAIRWVQRFRPRANPNPGFWMQLAIFEERCRPNAEEIMNEIHSMDLAKEQIKSMIPLPCYNQKVAISEDIEVDGCKCNLSSSSCIYLGPQQCARKEALQDIMAAKITGIVNCTKLYPNHHEDVDGIEYCNVPVNDECGANLLPYMERTTRFMRRHLLEDGRGSVLVHCQRGVSRSASMVVAYLIRYHDMCKEDAVRWVQRFRPRANPNPGFWIQLSTFEQRCRANPEEIKNERNSMAISKELSVQSMASEDWAKESLATYQTVGHLLSDPNENFPEYANAVSSLSLDDCKRVLFTALDFIYGRGILDTDLPWFSCLCRVLASNKEIDVARIVSSLLLDDDSEFVEAWVGEIYERDVKRIQHVCREALT